MSVSLSSSVSRLPYSQKRIVIMRRVTTVALVALFVITSAAMADSVWDYRSSYSTTDNSLGAGKFTTGFLSGAEGTFNIYDHYSTDTSYGGIYRWDWASHPGDNTDTRGNAGKNTTVNAVEQSGWGTGGIYYEAGATTLMPGTDGSWAALRWTAPAAGSYNVKAVFTDQCIDAGAGKTTTVYMREGHNNGSLFWNSTLAGFVGRAANGYLDTTGTNQSATYENVLTLAAGQAIDMVVASGSTQYLTTGVDFTIAVPEPACIVLLSSYLIGVLAYAWRKRK
jgi:hypothetical protein